MFKNHSGLEKRVGLIPDHVKMLLEDGLSVFVETGAGEGHRFLDAKYQSARETWCESTHSFFLPN
ncbi:MAG: hypothetical protein E2O68_04505 [Deltaproteobacteria bacterium]|nr:MAG: hypothetical protein E2O68_04505 [Deltaproteobacteria bacterium]